MSSPSNRLARWTSRWFLVSSGLRPIIPPLRLDQKLLGVCRGTSLDHLGNTRGHPWGLQGVGLGGSRGTHSRGLLAVTGARGRLGLTIRVPPLRLLLGLLAALFGLLEAPGPS
eukprot:53587-Pyramimonas_sp.AAC.1